MKHAITLVQTALADLYPQTSDAYSLAKVTGLSVMEAGRALKHLQEQGFAQTADEQGTANDLSCQYQAVQQEASVAPAPAITWLNMSGDVTITWDPANEEAMLALIQKKMDEGYRFFLVKPRFFGLLGNRKVPLKSAEEAREAGKVSADDALVGHAVSRICDPEVEQALRESKARLVEDTKTRSTLATVRVAQSASEVLKNQSVAVRAVVGG